MVKPASSRPRRPGRPRFVPTAAQRAKIAAMRGEGHTLTSMAAWAGVSIPTLKRAFTPELIENDPRLKSVIAVSFYEKALNGHVPSMNFWAKRFGWLPARPVEPKPSRAEPAVEAQAHWLADIPRDEEGRYVLRLKLGDDDVTQRIRHRIENRRTPEEEAEMAAWWREVSGREPPPPDDRP